MSRYYWVYPPSDRLPRKEIQYILQNIQGSFLQISYIEYLSLVFRLRRLEIKLSLVSSFKG